VWASDDIDTRGKKPLAASIEDAPPDSPALLQAQDNSILQSTRWAFDLSRKPEGLRLLSLKDGFVAAANLKGEVPLCVRGGLCCEADRWDAERGRLHLGPLRARSVRIDNDPLDDDMAWQETTRRREVKKTRKEMGEHVVQSV
jgi:hypothetical protein